MSKQLTTGQVYNAYDSIIKRVEEWVRAKNPTVWQCDDKEVRARLAQRIVELSVEAHTNIAAIRADQGDPVQFPARSSINLGDLRINSDTGAVTLEPRVWIRHIAIFAAMWVRLLLFLIVGLFRLSPKSSVPGSLLMEAGGGYEETDERLVRFCKQGPIAPLRKAKRVIIQSLKPPNLQTDPSFSYGQNPLSHFIGSQLQWSHKATLLLQHLLAPFIFLRALYACPTVALISRDFSYLPVVRWLDLKGLIDSILITTSSFQSQPLWMRALSRRQFQLHMIWYSQNFVPKVYVGETETSSLPQARHICVDVHWVWTKGFKAYLERLGQKSNIEVVGPILWYLPEHVQVPGATSLKVAIFDVTPAPESKSRFGALTNYYTVDLMEKFVGDVVEICREFESVSGKEVSILLKHKREVKIGRHAPEYIAFIDRLCALNGKFILLGHQTNLFGLLNDCAFSVSVPYTSTAYVSASLKRPAIYYDPFGRLQPHFEHDEFVSFVSDRAELRRLIFAHLCTKEPLGKLA